MNLSKKYFLVFISMIAINFLIGCSSRIEKQEIIETPKKELTKKEQSEELVSDYFEVILKGGKGDEYFCLSNYSGDFFSPRSYKILSSEISSNEKENNILVRVDSSNRSGSPITKTWKFFVKLKDISPYTKTIKYNMCIDSFVDSQEKPSMTYEQDKLIRELEKDIKR